jgi:hypothetical protein
MEPCELEEDEFNDLMRIARIYPTEARRCMDAKAYVAGCVMIGAALEANLIGMCHLYYEEIPPELVPKSAGKTKHLLKWGLADLIKIAKKCGWLPSRLSENDNWNPRKAHIGDYAELLRETRNLVHTGRYIKDYPKARITKRRMEKLFEILEVANDWFSDKINESLRKTIEEAERVTEQRY